MHAIDIAHTSLYRRWVFANGWAEGVGLSTLYIVSNVLASALFQTNHTLPVLTGVFLAFTLGALLEGVTVGVAQARVLRSEVVEFPRGLWVVATAFAVGLTWLLDISGELVAPFAANVGSDGAFGADSVLFQVLTSATGATNGLVLGILQWGVMPVNFRGATRWIWVNTLAWAVTMPLLGAGLRAIPWDGPLLVTWIGVFVVCGAAGLVTSGITGVTLVGLVAARPGSSDAASRDRLAA